MRRLRNGLFFASIWLLCSAVDLSANQTDSLLANPPATPPVGRSDPSDHSSHVLGFVRLGITHIISGYDHLLFLAGLLLVCRSFRSLVEIVTCFTVAHSLTLAAATLNWIHIPNRVIEPAIALSIIFVGVENIRTRGEPRFRKIITFLFGLIHGFGFATVLRQLGVAENGRDILLPLFSFNAGVEIGQIAVASVILPLFWWLPRFTWFAERGVRLGSALIAIIGFYWLVERLLFS